MQLQKLISIKSIFAFALMEAVVPCFAQHLWWRLPSGVKDATCIYGQIKVVLTHSTIYYCGCNWNPGEPAGGYTGIQDKGNDVHNMIFSIWDTTDSLHPKVTYAGADVNHSRFGGEGTGAHTDAVIGWKVGKVYEFFAQKVYDAADNQTDTTVYFKDPASGKWLKSATITSPNGQYKSVSRFGPTLAGFLENWSGQDRTAPKLALYRLWAGTSPSDMKEVTSAGGDGRWGTVGSWFYLAEGDTAQVDAALNKADRKGFVVGSNQPLDIESARGPKSLPVGG